MTDAEIVAGYLAGRPVKTLHSGVTNEPVYRALRKAGIEPQRARSWWPDAADLHRQGLTAYAIGKRLGRGVYGVKYALKAMESEP